MIVLAAVSTTVFACTFTGLLSVLLLVLGSVETNMSAAWKRNVKGAGTALAASTTGVGAYTVFGEYGHAHPVRTDLAGGVLVVVVSILILMIWRRQVKKGESRYK